MEFGILDTGIFIIYLLGTLAIGWYFKNRTDTSDEFMVANRGLGLSVFIATMVATSVGGGTLTGYIGQVYESGLVILPTVIVFFIIQFLIAKFLAEKVQKFEGYTAPDVLGKTYGRTSQLLAGISSMIYMLGAGPALQAIALGTVIEVITGIPFTIGATIAMVIIILYTYFSGMWGVAMTDYFQFVVMAIGVALVGWISLNQANGWSSVVPSIPSENLSFNANLPAILKLILVTSFPTLIDGNRYQRFYSAKDVGVAKKGYYIALLPWFFIYVSIFLLGFTGYVLIPNVPADKVFASLILQTLPIGLKGIVFAALVSAIMSTADSYMLVAATNFVQDIYKPYINPKATDKQILKVSRISVVVIGIVGLVLALAVPSVMGVWSIASTAYVAGSFIPMMYALFFKGKKSNKAAIASIVFAGGGSLVLEVMDMSILGQSPIFIGIIASLIIFALITYFDKEAVVDNN
ncbi:sodium:solute symporter family protein [Clostridium sp. Cult2]|uniref:sodium:solute symporter family protein n=1 Tax=Clostridium sp. Cult2 TaxID=2079003 RepID=UPI001F201696|nr:sodium:solute symporter family protein [Clostridium sp. Cult2]MCF6465966.1 hypothetical protein [Clostridium sp. Cult2]